MKVETKLEKNGLYPQVSIRVRGPGFIARGSLDSCGQIRLKYDGYLSPGKQIDLLILVAEETKKEAFWLN